jgi:hypothetical protein
MTSVRQYFNMILLQERNQNKIRLWQKNSIIVQTKGNGQF